MLDVVTGSEVVSPTCAGIKSRPLDSVGRTESRIAICVGGIVALCIGGIYILEFDIQATSEVKSSILS